MTDVADVVVVGGGIGGAALTTALARAGVAVTVLESTTRYEDRVRGESMQPWGVREARELGVEEVLLAAGAHVTPVWRQYRENGGEPGEIPMAIMVEGVPGSLNLAHPVACQALLDAAASAGATVVRGVTDVRLSGGLPRTVTFAVDGNERSVRTPLVVGADGRSSAVRRQAAIELQRQEAIGWVAGLLVDGLDGVPDDHDVMAAAGDVFFLLFHQGGGRARVYLCVGESGRRRFAGPDGRERFLAACAVASYPWSGTVAAGVPAGPVATYPGDDTWTAAPFAEGVVLVGDAAGHNDPIIGQGLSIALRDARLVRDLVLGGARRPADFEPYGDERNRRMARLRFVADILATVQAEDADNRAARRAWFGKRMAVMDPALAPLMLGAFSGPDTIPDEALDPALLEEIRGQ